MQIDISIYLDKKQGSAPDASWNKLDRTPDGTWHWGDTCYYADDNVHRRIMRFGFVQGAVTIDGDVIEFSYSPTFNDGNIFTDNRAYEKLIAQIIPVYLDYLIYKGFPTLKTLIDGRV